MSEGQSKAARRLSSQGEDQPKIKISKFTLATNDNDGHYENEAGAGVKSQKTDREMKTKSITGSLSKLARQSWIGNSRSMSPGKKIVNGTHDIPATIADGVAESSVAAYLADDTTGSDSENRPRSARSRRGTVRRTKSRRPLSSILSKPPTEITLPNVPSIPKSFSTDRLPLSSAYTSSETLPSLPKSKSFDRFQGHGTETPRRKDELWGAFRALDGEFPK